MAGLPPDAFAARLGQIADHLHGLAKTASEGLLEGLGEIAETAVARLVERTPRSDGPGPHIADGWTARQVDGGAGVLVIDIVNESPKATEKLRFADGRTADYTLLDVLEYGSQAHEIRPVNAEALHFFAGGDEVYTQFVKHPGTDPYAMVATTGAEVAVDVKRLIDATRRTLKVSLLGRRS